MRCRVLFDLVVDCGIPGGEQWSEKLLKREKKKNKNKKNKKTTHVVISLLSKKKCGRKASRVYIEI